jgi:hypothetical protein
MEKAAFNKNRFFTKKIDLNTSATPGAWLCVVLKLQPFARYIRNTWKVLKLSAGEGWRRLVEPIV